MNSRENSRRVLWLCLLLAVGTWMRAETREQHPFIKYGANSLRYDADAESIRYFFHKWSQVLATGRGSISIVHIGGSHVQAGTFPNQVRTRLLSAYPTLVGDRGLIFPYSAAARCNNPHDYKVHCAEKVTLTRNVYKSPAQRLGLCGIAVTAHDIPTRIQMLLTDYNIDYSVCRVTVLGYSPEGVIPHLSCGGSEMSPSYIDFRNHRYIFNLKQNVDSFSVLLPCEAGETFTLTGVSLGNRNAGISYHSVGVNGAAVTDYLKCGDFTTDLELLRPDLVIFGIGINDAHGAHFDTAAFRRNYMRLCDSVRSVNPKCAFIFITNNDSYLKTSRRSYKVNNNGLLAREVFYRLAAATGGAVWDQFEIMGGLRSMEKWQRAGLARADKVHFTHAGYLLLGDLLFEAVEKELEDADRTQPHPMRLKGKETPAARPSRPAALDSSAGERPLPRGLRRKPKPQPKADNASQSDKPTSDKPTKTSNSKPAPIPRDRFPYISY